MLEVDCNGVAVDRLLLLSLSRKLFLFCLGLSLREFGGPRGRIGTVAIDRRALGCGHRRRARIFRSRNALRIVKLLHGRR